MYEVPTRPVYRNFVINYNIITYGIIDNIVLTSIYYMIVTTLIPTLETFP